MKQWVLAARPRTLPAAIAPVVLGCAICDKPHAGAALAALLGAVLIQIATNFANDYFDFVKGADNDERVGPKRATQAGLVTPDQMKWAFILTFALTVPFILYLTVRGGWPLMVIGISSIASGVLYTGGPLPTGYMGLGEVASPCTASWRLAFMCVLVSPPAAFAICIRCRPKQHLVVTPFLFGPGFTLRSQCRSTISTLTNDLASM